ncbi:MAG: type IX secretion system membrane protein PorP/SprF [Saprospirales bacterium]|nr:MAG: type IX secretion system membrane protein PorP/SprF [Saprospirales bacterium]
MRSIPLLFLVFMILIVPAYGQQLPHFSMSALNKYQFNPAVSAFSDRLSAAGYHRDQWRSAPGGPSTQILNAFFPFDYGESALGFQFKNDAIGLERTMSIFVSYAHRFNTEYGSFAIAVNSGAEQKSIDQSRLRTPGGNYVEENIQHNDPLLDASGLRSLVPKFGLSAWYSYGRWDVGLSAQNFAIGSHFGGDLFSFNLNPVYSLYADYFYPVLEDWFVVPSVHIYSDLNQTQVHFSALGSYQNLYFGGLGLRGATSRSIDALTVMAGVKVNERFSIYYNYDIGLSSMYNPMNQTHEFALIYRGAEWPHSRQRPPVIYNPRFME